MIVIERLNIDLGDFNLSDITLRINEGDFFALLGPTGAGKTVLLEAIAGLMPVKAGKIFLHNRDITNLPPEKRGVGIMYQDYSLFPHLDVRENINYGLRYLTADASETLEHFNFLSNALGLRHILHRMPYTLSGGELQRVALARALMIKPKILLLDEPLSAIDPSFRSELQQLLKTLHRTTGTTFLMVTHNFTEALSLSTRAAIINGGKIEQEGDIRDLFQKPGTSFVADFVGMKNVLKTRVNGTCAKCGSLNIEIPHVSTDASCYIAIRPEDIIISRKKLSSSARNSFRAQVNAVIDHGFTYEVHCNVEGTIFKSIITKGALWDPQNP